MPAGQGGPRFDELSCRWHDLAERRLAHFVGLHHSGRWRLYYATEERFATHMLDVIRAARIWARLAGREPPMVTVPVAVPKASPAPTASTAPAAPPKRAGLRPAA